MKEKMELDWDYPEAHAIEHTATASEADGYGHINNMCLSQLA